MSKKKVAEKFNLLGPVEPKKPEELGVDRKNADSFKRPIKEGCTIYDIKRDGNGIDIIVNNRTVRLFSLEGNEWDSECFPELQDDFAQLSDGYYRGELFGLKPEGVSSFKSLDEFTAVSKRPKTNPKKVTNDLIEKHPLRIEIFDILSYEGKTTMSRPLYKRRELLKEIINETRNFGLVKSWIVTDHKELFNLFHKVIAEGYEGLIGKNSDSIYVPGSRNIDWIKIKKFTTVDLVVLGFYQSSACKKSGKKFSAMLVGSYNPDTKMFETMTKVVVGKKEISDEIYALAGKKTKVGRNVDKVILNNKTISFNPAIKKVKGDIPVEVVEYGSADRILIAEIKCLDITYTENTQSCRLSDDGKRAHSLRIAIFERIRSDKTKVKDITDINQIRKMYYDPAL